MHFSLIDLNIKPGQLLSSLVSSQSYLRSHLTIDEKHFLDELHQNPMQLANNFFLNPFLDYTII